MILYLDTSSLAKMYIEEAGSSLVRQWAEEAEILATCRVAYPEMVSALSRHFRGGTLSRAPYELILERFAEEWKHFAVVDFDEVEAGRLAAAHGLRGFDAVHLAAALLLASSDPALAVAFSSFDQKLNDAATAEGLTVLSR